ncbi:histidine phosphatase family protein [Paucibacter sp. B2R-40]|uniref:histidine phosphatase family protein n=1 Tax=Paucibacter sp. B2R-40 TaxID=2893554 RepID=UPI0021E50FC7|nr:histidine phosphatase family protein [Paucibacter sp. B2R-40]MCV2356807.1 histidine phosphatase family protein [Paucibacter sp. B2R-40]
MPLDSSTQILAIRHGETEWNRVKRIQGHTDIALSDLGLAQVRLLGLALQEQSIDAIYTSDLQRARQTAQAVIELAPHTGLNLRLDPQLRERSFGSFEGLTWEEIAARWPDQSERWRKRDAEFGAEGGETLGEFYQRSVAALTRIAMRHPGQTIVVVTHGGVLDCLYRAATGLGLQAPRTWVLGNAAVNRLLFTPVGFSLIGWSDASHLEPLGQDFAP